MQRYIISAISLILLIFICGVKTWAFYIALSLVILLAGYVLSKIENARFHKIAFTISVVSVALMIAVFLKWRIYFQKYFVYLPSLSYLGFRGIAYLTSVYKRRNIDLSAGLAQMLFFPMLVMGPISRVENFQENLHDYREVLRRLIRGLSMLIAGHLCGGYVITNISANLVINLNCSSLWMGALANSLEFYLVFAGYSHLIIGLGLLVGFKLPENFNNPYFATSISEFWRRWHMSLSYWIRDYLYIPLGGNRKGVVRKCLNILAAMSICGLWHGLSWHYLLWGLYHGALLSVESLMSHFGFSPLKKLFPMVYRPIKVVSTFILVTFGWLLFKYSMSDFVVYVKGMVSW